VALQPDPSIADGAKQQKSAMSSKTVETPSSFFFETVTLIVSRSDASRHRQFRLSDFRCVESQ